MLEEKKSVCRCMIPLGKMMEWCTLVEKANQMLRHDPEFLSAHSVYAQG